MVAFIIMDNKKYMFMSGLPRSGTNLLSAIFSQNSEVYLSPQSNLADHIRNIHKNIYKSEDWQLGLMHEQHKSLLNGTIKSFYENTSQKNIIDKSRLWGSPYFIRLLIEILGEKPKILCPVRPLIEVVASFIKKAQENPETNYIDKIMIEQDFMPYWYKNIDDARVDWLLSPNGMLNYSISSVYNALHSETKEMFYVYSYNDLVTNTKDTVDGIYRFLEVESYPHNFSNITNSEEHLDASVLGIPDFHLVRNKIELSSLNPEEVLSDYAITRCQIEDFWT